MTRTKSPGNLAIVSSGADRPPHPAKSRHPSIRLHNLNEIRLEMASCYRAAKRGDMPTSEAARLTYILSELVKLFHIKLIEDRINKLEKKL